MEKALETEANIAFFLKMAITLFPPGDLLLKPDSVKAAVRTLHEMVDRNEYKRR